MATFVGSLGKFIWDADSVGGGGDTTLANSVSWELNATRAFQDVTDQQNTGWREYLPSHIDWNGSVTCNLDTGKLDIPIATDVGVTILATQNIECEFWLDDTGAAEKVLYGPGACESVSIDLGAGEIAKVTYNLVGNGALQWAATTPTY